MASCLAEWLEWVLGLLLIPQRLTVPAGGQRRREWRVAALTSPGRRLAGPCPNSSSYLSGARHGTRMTLLAGTLLGLSSLLRALSLARIGCAKVKSRELMVEKSFEIPADQNWKHP